MSVRLHCRQRSTGYDYYLEFSAMEPAIAQAKRLAEMGFVGVASVPQQKTQLQTLLAHVITLLQQMQKQNTLLADLLAQAQAQNHRVLDTPPPSTPAEAPPSASPVVASDQPASGLRVPMPPRWGAVLRHMQQHPGPHHPREVTRALGREHGTPDVMRKVMQRMAQRGLLVRTGADGCYQLATAV